MPRSAIEQPHFLTSLIDVALNDVELNDVALNSVSCSSPIQAA
jgi:hypothetical protein